MATFEPLIVEHWYRITPDFDTRHCCTDVALRVCRKAKEPPPDEGERSESAYREKRQMPVVTTAKPLRYHKSQAGVGECITGPLFSRTRFLRLQRALPISVGSLIFASPHGGERRFTNRRLCSTVLLPLARHPVGKASGWRLLLAAAEARHKNGDR